MDWVDSLAFLLASALSFVASARWASRSGSGDTTETVLLAVFAWISLVVLTPLILSAFGVLHPLSLHLVVGGCASAALVWTRGSPVSPKHSPPRAPSTLQRALALIGVLGVGVPLSIEVWRGVHRAPWDGDSLLYHLPILQERLLSGSYWDLTAPFSHYPSFAGFVGSWFFSRSWYDALLNLQNVAPYLLLVCGIVVLARRLGASSGSAWLGAAIFVQNARMIARQITTQESDLLLAALLLMAWTWSLDAELRRSQRWRLALALALAVGCKYSGLPLAAWVALQAITKRASRSSWRVAVREWVGPVALIAGLGALPYVRNLWLAGTPIFPKEIASVGWTALQGVDPSGIFGSAEQSMSLVEVLTRSVAVWRAWTLGVVDHLGWWPLLGWAVVLGGFFSRRAAVGRAEALWLLGVTTLMGIVTPAFPRWEDAPIPQWLVQGYSPARFALLPMAVGAAFSALGVDFVLRRLTRRWDAVTSGGHAWPPLPPGVGAVAVALMLTALLAIAAASPSAERARSASRSAEFEGYQPDSGELLRWCDAHLAGERVLVVGHTMRPWFFVGRNFDNRVRRPESSAWPIFGDATKEPSVIIIAPGAETTEWKRELGRRYPGVKPLGFGQGYEVWRVAE